MANKPNIQYCIEDLRDAGIGLVAGENTTLNLLYP